MSDLDVHAPAIAGGDAEAFARWMQGAERILRDSLRPFARAVDVEAVLQESLLRVWQVAPRFESDGRPNGLLRLGLRIARNLAISETRRMRAQPIEAADLERELAALERVDRLREPDPLLRQTIAECREKLPLKPRAALEARLHSEGSEPDAALAGRLNMRVNTFLQNFTRARKLLKDCLRAHGVDLEAELA